MACRLGTLCMYEACKHSVAGSDSRATSTRGWRLARSLPICSRRSNWPQCSSICVFVPQNIAENDATVMYSLPIRESISAATKCNACVISALRLHLLRGLCCSDIENSSSSQSQQMAASQSSLLCPSPVVKKHVRLESRATSCSREADNERTARVAACIAACKQHIDDTSTNSQRVSAL